MNSAQAFDSERVLAASRRVADTTAAHEALCEQEREVRQKLIELADDVNRTWGAMQSARDALLSEISGESNGHQG